MKRHLQKISAVLFFTVISSIALFSQNFKTVGYLPTYRFNLIDDIALDRLTHLNIAFANPDATGMLSTGGVDIEPVVQQAHAAGLEVFIALAGGAGTLADWENWITPANRSFLIHNIIDYTLQYNLQGIDVDLEWGLVNDDYSGFVIELKDSVDQHDLQLSVAFPGTFRYPEVTDEALAVFDWVNLMVYDLTGPWQPNNPGPHSPYSFALNSIDYWVAQGVDKSDMTLGVPFYGYDFTDQNNVVSVKYSDMVALDPSYSQLDQVGEIYYNGMPTIEQKTILAIEELSGVMIWELGQDSFDEYSLLKVIDETIDMYLISSAHAADQSIAARLYPNPASEYVQIEFDEAQDARVVLLSNCSKVLKSEAFYNERNITLDVDELAEGMYYVLVESSNFRQTFKLAVF